MRILRLKITYEDLEDTWSVIRLTDCPAMSWRSWGGGEQWPKTSRTCEIPLGHPLWGTRRPKKVPSRAAHPVTLHMGVGRYGGTLCYRSYNFSCILGKAYPWIMVKIQFQCQFYQKSSCPVENKRRTARCTPSLQTALAMACT